MIFDRLEPVLLQKRVMPLAGKIVIMLDLGPIRIDLIGVQQPQTMFSMFGIDKKRMPPCRKSR